MRGSMGNTTFRPLERPDADEVVRWRLERLLEAGYEAETASFLADRLHVDLHVAIRLVQRGCPSATAVRILI